MYKLTPAIVRILRKIKQQEWRISNQELADWVANEYGITVSHETVRLAINGTNWSAVRDQEPGPTSYGHTGG